LGFQITDIAEIIAELRQEVGKEPSENAPRCAFCGAILDNQPKGRDRLYCDNKGKCKQAHHRQKQREERRATILREHRGLLDSWRQEHLSDELIALLQGILLEKGEEAAREATIAVVAYVEQERERWERTREPQPEKRPTSRRTRKK
jgi:hypothetical protein